MNAAFSEGFPFELDVWRQSTFLLDDQSAALFIPLEPEPPTLEVHHGHGLFGQDFDLPELGDSHGVDDERLRDLQRKISDPLELAPISSRSAESPIDVWNLDTSLDHAKAIPCLRTWEDFNEKHLPNPERTALLSEAGQSVFDVVVQRIEQRPVESGVLPQNVLLRALYHLALGRSSLFFRWDAERNSFVRTLANVPMSGYSATSSDSVVQRVLGLGTRFRTLDRFSRSAHAREHTCTALTALKGSITKALDGIEKHITVAIAHVRSLPQLSKVFERPCELLGILESLMNAAHDLNEDEDVISAISDIVNESFTTHPLFAGVLQTLLARVSAPWLERLCVDLHLREDSLSLRPFEDEGYEHDALQSPDLPLEPVEMDQGALPHFVDKEDRALILDCKRSLASLRKQLPGHTPTFSQTNDNYLTLFADGGPSHSKGDGELATALDKNLAWSDTEAQSDYLGALNSRMSQSFTMTEEVLDGFTATLDAALVADVGSVKNSTELDRHDFNPIEKLRPLIQAHAKLINEAVLRHIFWTCRLQDHLDLHHQYHLFGNGDFVARLSTALFSNETQSAERKKGNVPTGEAMGLRLGTRDEQRWPPASSELRLTLAGVLTETYRPSGPLAEVTKVDVKQLPGGLSFSIRELPDDEIERVLESGSVYALDFLRLQYHIPPGLEAVITKSCMQTYDAIFLQLLRILRMLDVATKLKERTRLAMAERNTHVIREAKLASEAHHFVSVIMSHVLDIGVRSPWQAFLSSVGQVEAALTTQNERHENKIMIGLDGLRGLHEHCLDTIRSRIFLRQKHQQVRSGIEEVFTAILRCSASLEKNESDAFRTSVMKFKDGVKGLLTTLRTAVNRPGKVRVDMSVGDGDAEAMSLLLEKLNWNEFYRNS